MYVCICEQIDPWKWVLAPSAGHLFFFFEDGSCKSSFVWTLRKIIAQLQTAVAGRGMPVCGKQQEKGVEVGSGSEERSRITRACQANGRWDRGQDSILVCEFVCTVIEMQYVDYRALLTKTRKLLKASTHRAAHSNRVISSSDDFWYVVFLPRFTAPGSSQSPGLQRDQCWEHILLWQWLGACSQRWKRSLWI